LALEVGGNWKIGIRRQIRKPHYLNGFGFEGPFVQFDGFGAITAESDVWSCFHCVSSGDEYNGKSGFELVVLEDKPLVLYGTALKLHIQRNYFRVNEYGEKIVNFKFFQNTLDRIPFV